MELPGAASLRCSSKRSCLRAPATSPSECLAWFIPAQVYGKIISASVPAVELSTRGTVAVELPTRGTAPGDEVALCVIAEAIW